MHILLQRLFQRPQNKPLSRRKANRRANLVLEHLEDRTVPSSFTVTFSETGVPGTTVTVTDNNPVNSLGGLGDTDPTVGTISVTGLTVGDFTVSGQSTFSNSSQGTLPAVVTSTITAFNNDPGVSHQLIITTLDTGFNVPPGGTTVNMATTLADTSPLAQPTDTFFSTLGGVNGTTLTSTSSPSAASVTDSETIPTTPYSLGNTLSVTVVGAAPIGGEGNTEGEVQVQGTTKISPATPAINTSQQPASATVGTSIADKATVTGGDSPTGTVTFNLYNNPNGTGPALFTDTETLVGGMATSASYTATATGTDYWVATYNGDSNNAAVTSGTADEPVIVSPATPAINTSQQPASATVGTSIADKATVSGGDSPTGTVTFNLYNNPNGTGPALFTDTETLVGGTATSAGYTTTATGTDYWVATYNGDSNNAAVTSGTALEPVIVSPATPAINTTQQPASATVGTSIADKATVSGGYKPTGTVTFNLYSNATGSGTPLFTDTETLAGNSATSKGYATAAAGTDYWVATYNGDSNNAAVTSGTALEPVIISPTTPMIQIIKLTNGTNNDSAPGLSVPVGTPITWTYFVTATGSNEPIKNVVVTDDNGTPGNTADDFHPSPVLSGGFNVGDTNHDGLLDPTETWQYTASGGNAVAGQYTNNSVVTGNGNVSNTPVTAQNPDNYFGLLPQIQIVKLTNGTNNDNPPVAGVPDGPIVPVGSTVTWTYDVSTTGNVPLSSVAVTDNIAGVNPTPVLSGGFNVGDTNHDNLLEPGETWVFTASGTAIAGQYSNIGTVTGIPSTPAGTPIPGAPTQTATNPDHYFGENPQIQILKLTNGTNNDNPPVAGVPDGPIVPVGSTVTWTYNVTNPGNVPLSNVTVTDNIAGVNPTPVLSGGFNVGDTNHDNLLEPGETWVFTASGTAIAGQYSNIGTATGTPPTGPNVTNTNPDHYFGRAQAELALTKTVDQSQVMFGDNVTFTLTVSNQGPDAATDVIVLDPLPSGLAFVSAATAQGAYAPASGMWMVGTLANGSAATLQVTARVAALGPIVNNAEAAALQFDTGRTNNAAIAAVTGTNPASIISKQSFLASTPPNPAPAADPAEPMPSLDALRADIVFVNGLYREVLGHDAEPAAMAYWMNSLLLGGSRSAVAQGVLDSPEHLGLEVDQLYANLLHRPADANGRAFWVNALLAGESEADVEASILASPEYQATHAADAAFVAGLFQNVLGRAADSTGQAYWMGQLQGGATRQQVIAGFLSSGEALGRAVDGDFAAYLRRPADAVGRQFFLDQLFAGGPGQTEAVAVQILASEEFFNDMVGA